MRKDLVIVVLLWAVLTAVGEALIFTTNIFPTVAAEEAVMIDDAFRLLMILSMPVAALVLAWFGYSLYRFRANKENGDEDGAPLRRNPPLAWGWFLASTALSIIVIFNPGLKGVNELNANPNADLVIQIEAQQWHWNVTYPQYDLNYQRALQIAVPVDTRVKFEITSQDVIHSFWIPAFRMKIDAVPGQTTSMYLTPTEIGEFENDPNMRVQCAELCGTGHARMQMAVRVMEPDQFELWLAEAREMTMGGEMDMPGMDMGSESGMEGTEMDSDSDGMDMDAESGEMNMNNNDGMDTDSENMNMNSDEMDSDGMDMDSDGS